MSEARIVYSTSTAQAAADAARAREGIVVTCPSCEEMVRIYRAKPPTGYWLCGRCEDS